MIRRVLILLIVVFGFLMKPAEGHAHDTHTSKAEMSCCDQLKSAEHTEHSDGCCENHQAHNHEHDGDCDGECEHSGCYCPVVTSVVPMVLVSENSSVSSDMDQFNLSYTEAFIPSVFISIWVPPKIS